MKNGHLVGVTTLLVCGEYRHEYYGVANSDPALARELVLATQPITSDQSVRVTASLAAPVLNKLAMHPDQVCFLGMSEAGRAASRVAVDEWIPDAIAA